MKAYFTHVNLEIHWPKESSPYYKKRIDFVIRKKLLRLGWPKDRLEVLNGGDEKDLKDSGLGGEGEGEYPYFHDFDTSEVRLIYRKALMSFVDHYAALCLLERRSARLPVAETINLCSSPFVTQNFIIIHGRIWRRSLKEHGRISDQPILMEART
jgi:hypothetical protein